MSDLGDLIRGARFSTVRRAEGYDMDQVDYLLDRLLAAAENGEPVAPILDGVEISQVRVREGYDIAEVEAFLARVAGAGDVSTGSTSGAGDVSTGSTSRRGGILGRLLRRKR